MICWEVVPRTMESSTRRTFLPRNSSSMAFNFWRTDFLRWVCPGTDFLRWVCPGMMKVRPM